MQLVTTRARCWEQRHTHIERTALELFRSRGFDQVTVEDVSAAAGVAPATFYRHFRTKEDVVFAYTEDFAAALRQAIAAAADLVESSRLPVVLDRFAEYLESRRDALALRDEIVLGHARLMQRTLTVQRDLETVLAEGLADLSGRNPVDAAARLQAGLGILVLRVAVRVWRAEDQASLPVLVGNVLTCLEEMVGSLTHGTAATPSPRRP